MSSPTAGDGTEHGKMTRKVYEAELRRLQGELVAMQEWVKATGAKICIVFEGRDTAGKGGTIKRITERVSPRTFRVVALPAPTDREKSQMYVQRYISHFPAAGEVVIFDRSWYNRAGVEPVMGFCTPEQSQRFLDQVPAVEHAMVESGILLFKYWLEVSPHEQTTAPAEPDRRSAQDLEAVRHGPASPTAAGTTTPAHAIGCSPRPTPHGRRGSSPTPTTRSVGGSTSSPTCWRTCRTSRWRHRDVKLPRRQSARGYVEPDLPLRLVPEKF